MDAIDRFTDDVRKAEGKIARYEQTIEELRPELDRRRRWDAAHSWPDSRLRAVDPELVELGQSVRQVEGVTRDALLGRAPGRENPWLDRIAEIAAPRLPGPDLGAGIDFGR